MASDSESKPSALEIPAPEESDSAQVVSCLELAAELWKSGQHKEAIRFIQRGAAAAEEDGNDMRALKLARLGADLSAQVAEAAPAAAAPAVAPAASGSNGAAAKSLPSAPSTRPHPANHPSVRVSQPPPLPAGSTAGQPTPSPPSVAPTPPSVAADKEKSLAADKDKSATADKEKGSDKEKAADKEKVAAADKAKDDDKAKDTDAVAAAPSAPGASSSSSSAGPSSARGSRTPATERASVKPSAPRTGASLVASAPPKPSTPPTPSASTSSSVAELIASGLAERVSVKRSSLDTSLLVVRPMSGNGARPAAHGARQAVLIYVDSDAEA
jgi:hypothetical protein